MTEQEKAQAGQDEQDDPRQVADGVETWPEVAEDTEAEESEEEDEADDALKPMAVMHGKDIVDCHGMQDGSLGKLLEKLSVEVIHENDYKVFKRIYGDVNNTMPCPCGQPVTLTEVGKSAVGLFQACCKNNWNLLRRAHKNRKKMARADQKTRAQIDGLVQYTLVLEVLKDGRMRYRTPEGAPELAGGAVQEILHTAWVNCLTDGIMNMARIQMANLMNASPSDLAKLGIKKPGGGSIITP